VTVKPVRPACSRSALVCSRLIGRSPGSPHFWIWNLATSSPTSLSNRLESRRFRPPSSLTFVQGIDEPVDRVAERTLDHLNGLDHLVGRTREIPSWLLDAAVGERAVTPLDVVVGSGRIAGVPDEPELLPGGDVLPEADGDRGEVAVCRTLARRVLNDDMLAVRRPPGCASEDNLPSTYARDLPGHFDQSLRLPVDGAGGLEIARVAHHSAQNDAASNLGFSHLSQRVRRDST
jgi:hypothetical protein